MSTVTLGGDRLGSGNKQKVHLHGFERSTHDLGYVWRNTQAPGTLVPFMVQLALPGDSFDINLGADVKTHPTTGPLFGSFKLQLDVFEAPIRLYHSWLHNNKLGIGLAMETVKLPKIRVNANPLIWLDDSLNPGYPNINNQQIHPSALLNYLGIKGVGNMDYDSYRLFNAVPFLAYWEIYKNYYSAKQEEIGMMIHNEDANPNVLTPVVVAGDNSYSGVPYNMNMQFISGDSMTVTVDVSTEEEPERISVFYFTDYDQFFHVVTWPKFSFTSSTDMGAYWQIVVTWNPTENGFLMGVTDLVDKLNEQLDNIQIVNFPLSNIDDMRELILKHDNSSEFIIDDESQAPYGLPLKDFLSAWSRGQTCSVTNQEGLALKTYQSDMFNNWLNTEWLDGSGGINEITAVATDQGSFEINTLNLAQKVYDMLNRIAVSGGTYDDWLDAVYDNNVYRKCESPMYHGGLSKEIIFQEVVSKSETTDNPLGTLGGKGTMSPKHKGGQVNIKVSEPSFLIGIVSITPRIDYSQGNDYFVNHVTLNDLHKPSLDQIGFQDLVTDKMAFWDTYEERGDLIYKSAGKQPAWIDYMTNYNRLHGNFALEDNEMFMTLCRRYEPDADTKSIKDLTAYIDPSKFNYAFAQTDIAAQNFWVQIGVDITARRKMSSKIMPNL